MWSAMKRCARFSFRWSTLFKASYFQLSQHRWSIISSLSWDPCLLMVKQAGKSLHSI